MEITEFRAKPKLVKQEKILRRLHCPTCVQHQCAWHLYVRVNWEQQATLASLTEQKETGHTGPIQTKKLIMGTVAHCRAWPNSQPNPPPIAISSPLHPERWNYNTHLARQWEPLKWYCCIPWFKLWRSGPQSLRWHHAAWEHHCRQTLPPKTCFSQRAALPT